MNAGSFCRIFASLLFYFQAVQISLQTWFFIFFCRFQLRVLFLWRINATKGISKCSHVVNKMHYTISKCARITHTLTHKREREKERASEFYWFTFVVQQLLPATSAAKLLHLATWKTFSWFFFGVRQIYSIETRDERVRWQQQRYKQ